VDQGVIIGRLGVDWGALARNGGWLLFLVEQTNVLELTVEMDDFPEGGGRR
jgi:hypothetical protein